MVVDQIYICSAVAQRAQEFVDNFIFLLVQSQGSTLKVVVVIPQGLAALLRELVEFLELLHPGLAKPLGQHCPQLAHSYWHDFHCAYVLCCPLFQGVLGDDDPFLCVIYLLLVQVLI